MRRGAQLHSFFIMAYRDTREKWKPLRLRESMKGGGLGGGKSLQGRMITHRALPPFSPPPPIPPPTLPRSPSVPCPPLPPPHLPLALLTGATGVGGRGQCMGGREAGLMEGVRAVGDMSGRAGGWTGPGLIAM